MQLEVFRIASGIITDNQDVAVSESHSLQRTHNVHSNTREGHLNDRKRLKGVRAGLSFVG